jgi:hypothetical protein
VATHQSVVLDQGHAARRPEAGRPCTGGNHSVGGVFDDARQDPFGRAEMGDDQAGSRFVRIDETLLLN